MQRRRDTSRWSPHFEHATTDMFLASAPESGLHTVHHAGQHLDILIRNRSADATLVVFHSSISSSIETVPTFQGEGLAETYGANLIAVADPSIAMGDLNLGWHLGNKVIGSLKPIIAPLLQHTARTLGSDRTVVLGASGGAYAAIHYGDLFHNAIVLAWNPRLDLGATPETAFRNYAFVAYGAGKRATQERLLRRLQTDAPTAKLTGGAPFHLCIFQNTGDSTYYNHQLSPFLDRMHNPHKIYLRTEYTADGHKGVPSAIRKAMLQALLGPYPLAEAIRRAGFVSFT